MGTSRIHTGGSKDHNDDIETTESSGQVNVHVTGTDDLLDEIDGLLEANAEEFVRAYVQKGGQ